MNNAGILVSGNIVHFNEADFDRLIAVNLKGMIHTVKAAAPGMIERKYGKDHQSFVDRRFRHGRA